MQRACTGFIDTVQCYAALVAKQLRCPHASYRTCRLLAAVCPCSNLLAVCGVICLQQSLSLRTQIVNPLVVIFIVLASTAALVRMSCVVVLPHTPPTP
jgi:hypothetical protein